MTSNIVLRADNSVVDSFNTDMNTYNGNIWIDESSNSTIPLNWKMVIEQAKLFHLGYYASRVPIEDYYFLDKNKIISKMFD